MMVKKDIKSPVGPDVDLLERSRASYVQANLDRAEGKSFEPQQHFVA